MDRGIEIHIINVLKLYMNNLTQQDIEDTGNLVAVHKNNEIKFAELEANNEND